MKRGRAKSNTKFKLKNDVSETNVAIILVQRIYVVRTLNGVIGKPI